jgi:Rrf2 family protein
MKLTAQIEYAYWALLDIADRYDPNVTVNLNQISTNNAIPEKYLLQVMLKLKKEGIVRSRRGSGGGFQLAKPPEKILLSDIIAILGASQREINSAFKPEAENRPNQDSAFFKIWRTGQDAFFKEMKQYNLKQLLQKEKRSRKRA